MGQWRLRDMFVGFWPPISRIPWTPIIGVMFANLAGARPWAGCTESLAALLRFDLSRLFLSQPGMYVSWGYWFRQDPWALSQLWSHINNYSLSWMLVLIFRLFGHSCQWIAKDLDLIKISCLFGRDSPTLAFAPRRWFWWLRWPIPFRNMSLGHYRWWVCEPNMAGKDTSDRQDRDTKPPMGWWCDGGCMPKKNSGRGRAFPSGMVSFWSTKLVPPNHWLVHMVAGRPEQNGTDGTYMNILKIGYCS